MSIEIQIKREAEEFYKTYGAYLDGVERYEVVDRLRGDEYFEYLVRSRENLERVANSDDVHENVREKAARALSETNAALDMYGSATVWSMRGDDEEVESA